MTDSSNDIPDDDADAREEAHRIAEQLIAQVLADTGDE